MSDSISAAYDAGYKSLTHKEQEDIRRSVAENYIGKIVVNSSGELGRVTSVDTTQYMFEWVGTNLLGKPWKGRALTTVCERDVKILEKELDL